MWQPTWGTSKFWVSWERSYMYQMTLFWMLFWEMLRQSFFLLITLIFFFFLMNYAKNLFEPFGDGSRDCLCDWTSDNGVAALWRLRWLRVQVLEVSWQCFLLSRQLHMKLLRTLEEKCIFGSFLKSVLALDPRCLSEWSLCGRRANRFTTFFVSVNMYLQSKDLWFVPVPLVINWISYV